MKPEQFDILYLAWQCLERAAVAIVKYETEQHAPHYGKKVYSVNGSILDKFKHPHAPGYSADKGTRETWKHGVYWNMTHYWITAQYDEIRVHVKTCVNGGSYEDNSAWTQYAEQSYTIAANAGNILTELPEEKRPLIETLEHPAVIRGHADATKALQKQYEEARGKVDARFHSTLNIYRLTHT